MDQQLIEALLKARRLAYAVTDRSLVIQEVHDPYGLLGLESQDPKGISLYEVAPELVGSEAALRALLKGGTSVQRLPQVNRHDTEGNTLYLDLINAPYCDEGGAITGILHMVEDASESGALQQRLMQQRNMLRLAEDALRQTNRRLTAANAELEQLDDIKTVFVSIAAHELKTPLSSIVGYADLLLNVDNSPMTDLQRTALQVILRSSQRLLAIANNLLDATRIEAGRLELTLNICRLGNHVQAVLSELAPEYQRKRLAVRVRESPDLDLAWCDRLRSEQIIQNLVSNAIKYSPAGSSIDIALNPSEDGAYVVLSVADNGIGISSEDQQKLFTRFFRADSVRESDARGTGLGLYITKALVELHGGCLWVESEKGQGSTFYATFLAAQAEDADGF